jgi:glycosyltransferase involved in cell wall biosynthesis
VKVLQAVGWYYPDSWGGTEIYVSALAGRLRAAGHEVGIAAPDASHRTERRYEHDGIPVYRYPIPSDPTRAEAQGGVTVRGAERFHRWIEDFRPDVAHFHTFVTGLGLAELDAARRAGARVIVTTHAASLGFICARGTMMRMGVELCDGLTEERKCAACMLQHRGLPAPAAEMIAGTPAPVADVLRCLPGPVGAAFGLPAFIRDQKARQARLLATADRFVLLTDWAGRTVLANHAPPSRVTVNRLGIATRPPARKPPPEARPTTRPVRFGYYGRFDAIKGVRDVVRSLTSLRADASLRAEIVGPVFNSAEERVVADLKKLIGSDARITIGAAVPHAQVPRALAALDVLVCPSLVAEGGPTVAIEAHAVGTPVIGTRIGGLAEMVTDGMNGRLVAPGDWRALARVMQTIVDDPVGTVDHWRRMLPPPRTFDDVTRDYLSLYAA